MYQIYVDNELFCDSRVDDLAIINPLINLEANKAGTFSFTIPPIHPYYNAIQRRKSQVTVIRDDEDVFHGFCTAITDDFFLQRKVECEGDLSRLNDTTQRPSRYSGVTSRQLLEAYIANHNAAVSADEQFTVGIVTANDSNDSISCYTNYESTMKSIKEDLVDDIGGYIRVRYADGKRYIDYLADSPNTCSQIVALGENILDFNTSLDATNITTVIIPLGATLETQSIQGLDDRVTIKSVNDGKDYLESADAIATFGRVEKVVTWNDVTTPTALKSKAQKYLEDTQFENMVISAKAVDLHLDNPDIEHFKLLDKIRVVSKPHGLNKYFLLTKMSLNLNNPQNDTITLGSEEKVALTAKSTSDDAALKKQIDEISPSSILKSAKENATQLIQNAGNGYVSITYDKDMHPTELLIMDTPSKETATKVWRWNQNGLGYSSTGYNGTYGLAMTSDGRIVADYITTGTLSADRIKGGTLSLGGANDVNGIAKVYDSNSRLCSQWSNAGLFTYSDNDFRSIITNANMVIVHPTLSASAQLTHGTTTASGIGTVNVGQLMLASEKGARTIVSPYGISINANMGKGSGYIGYPFNILHYPTTIEADFSCTGTKSRIADTDDYGKRLMYCYEMPTPMFGDIGEASTDEEGTCFIAIEDIFGETVDTEVSYQVFLQPYGDGRVYIAERTPTYFVVKGTPNLDFGWELKAVQNEYDSMRLDYYTEEENEQSEINNDNE